MSAPDPVPPDARTPPTPAPPPPAPARRIVDGGFLVLLGFTALGMAGVWLLKGPGRLGAILLQEAGFILALSPKLLGGVFIAATLPLLMPRDRVAGWLGRDSGWRGLALASAAGAVIPGGPAMIFLLASGFAAAGADLGALAAFVSGWSLLGLNRTLIWEFSFLPWDIVALRYALCLPFPVLIGLAARRLGRRLGRRRRGGVRA